MAVWYLIIANPVLNVLVALTQLVGGDFGLAIIALTVIVRLISWPLTKRQLNSTKAMQEMQPKVRSCRRNMVRIKRSFSKR